MSKPIGIYIHVPFCKGKCKYCDFYSVNTDVQLIEAYTKALCSTIERFPAERKADTVYFGGGTPNLLGEKNLLTVLDVVDRKFGIENNAEVTVEVNPGDDLKDTLKTLCHGGFNRLSIGMQSAHDNELAALGRRHCAADTEKVVEWAKTAGFKRYSLDLMMAIPQQTEESLSASIQKCIELEASHVSAYLLKVEEGTEFYRAKNQLALPDEETVCNLYLSACAQFEKNGLMQYEISNFAREGEESRHNLKYWLDEEYLGFGPAAYSFYNGNRFHFSRDLQGFIQNAPFIFDEPGGDMEEYLMMRLRLKRGLEKAETDKYCGDGVFDAIAKKASVYEKCGYVRVRKERISFTPQGFLVSNYLISRLLPM